jgi:hypothetical protein
MKLRKSIKLIIVSVGIAVLSFAFIGTSLDYYLFQTRGEEYYSNLASDCKSLFIEIGHEGENATDLRSDDPALPKRIKDLHPTAIHITPKGVSIILGHGIQTYKLIWGPSSNGLVEEFRLVHERSSKVLCSTNR